MEKLVTYKIPFHYNETLNDHIREFNSCFRYSYNRFKDNPSMKPYDVEKYVKENIQNCDLLDVWLKACCVERAKEQLKKNREKVIFGGRKNFFERLKGNISKQEFQKKRMIPFCSYGEKNYYGNRKFTLDIQNNQIIFKPSRNVRIPLVFKGFSKKWKDNLFKLQEISNLKETPVTISFDYEYVYITFDILKVEFKPIKIIQNRFAAIDLNPNQISLVIGDYNKDGLYQIIEKRVYSLYDLTGKISNLNKLKFEILEVSKSISELCKHYRIEALFHEKLSIQSSNKGLGKNFNRLCNNIWLRNTFINNLQKRLSIYGIQTQEIAAQYSSFIGQINHPEDCDSIAAAREIGRRGNLFYRIYIRKDLNKTDIIYPSLPKDSLMNHWKKKLGLKVDTFSDWKTFYETVKKTSGLKYRNLLDLKKSSFFELASYKSKVKVVKPCFNV